MASLSWKNPPPVVVIGGTQDFLRRREVSNAIRVAENAGFSVERVDSAEEIEDLLSMAGTFGTPTLIISHPKFVSPEDAEAWQKDPTPKTCILVEVDGILDEKKFPFLACIHGAYQVSHNDPSSRKDKKQLAVRFGQAEADRLLKDKGTLEAKLAEALVKAVGTDLGVVAFEISKMSAIARAQGGSKISVDHIRALIRPSSDIDMAPLRTALGNRDVAATARQLDRIRSNSPSDPVMLLLRARGGPADLVLTWLRCGLMREAGAEPAQIAATLGVPEWALMQDVIPCAQRWGVHMLRQTLRGLAEVDRATLNGAPAPFEACASVLLSGCCAELP